MATLVEQCVFAKSYVHALSELGVQIGAAWKRLGVVGRRAVLTVFGAVFALTCGGAVADVVRLPADMRSAMQPGDMTVQTELPSEAAARAYALDNPPTVAIKPDANADIAPLNDVPPDINTAFSDDTAPRTAHAVPDADDEDKAAPTAAAKDTVAAPVAAADSSGA